MTADISLSQETHFLTTLDGQRIAYSHDKGGHRRAIILAHGYFNNKDTFLFRQIADMLIEKFDVIRFDFRGHGQSSGWFSWTAKESNDLKCVLNYASQRYPKVGVLAFSLGGAIAIVEASVNPQIQSLMTVSAPASVWRINYHFWKKEMWQDLLLNLGPKGKGKRVRPGFPFDRKIKPIDVVHRIAPRPICFVHGANDWLILPRHSLRLFENARDPKECYILDGTGHAEKIADQAPDRFKRLCLDWFMSSL